MEKVFAMVEEKMGKTVSVLSAEFASIRAGRANSAVLDKIKVDYYGTMTPLQQVGNISVPEARIIVIQPWERRKPCHSLHNRRICERSKIGI